MDISNNTVIEFLDSNHLLYENSLLRKIIKERDKTIKELDNIIIKKDKEITNIKYEIYLNSKAMCRPFGV